MLKQRAQNNDGDEAEAKAEAETNAKAGDITRPVAGKTYQWLGQYVNKAGDTVPKDVTFTFGVEKNGKLTPKKDIDTLTQGTWQDDIVDVTVHSRKEIPLDEEEQAKNPNQPKFRVEEITFNMKAKLFIDLADNIVIKGENDKMSYYFICYAPADL